MADRDEFRLQLHIRSIMCAAEPESAARLRVALARRGLRVAEEAKPWRNFEVVYGYRSDKVELVGVPRRFAHASASATATALDVLATRVREDFEVRARVEFADHGHALWTRHQWHAVVDTQTLARIGVEIYAHTEREVSTALDLVAEALDYHRDDLTIKPKPGWNGYPQWYEGELGPPPPPSGER